MLDIEAKPIKYYNVIGYGIIALLAEKYKPCEDAEDKYGANYYSYTFMTRSYIFRVKFDKWDSGSWGWIYGYVDLEIDTRFTKKIEIEPGIPIENVNAMDFSFDHAMLVKPEFWEKHHADRLTLSAHIYGAAYDKHRPIWIISYLYDELDSVAAIRPSGIKPSDIFVPEEVIKIKVRGCITRHDECSVTKIDGRWSCSGDKEEFSNLLINDREYYNADGSDAEEHHCEPNDELFRYKIKFLKKKTSYIYIDVAYGGSYYMFRLARDSRAVLAVKEFANVDTCEFETRVAEQQNPAYLGGLMDWLNDRKKGIKLFDRALSYYDIDISTVA